MTPVGNTIASQNRSTARTYALSANGDGYEWGGGCWNKNGIDDSPTAENANGEGADCSGFVFKTWKLNNTYGSTGWRGWSALEFIHGPYTAADIKADAGGAMYDLDKSYGATTSMDAFASSSHTGMLYAENTNGSDSIIEAKGDAYGTGIWSRTYRSDTAYDATARVGWATGCTGCG